MSKSFTREERRVRKSNRGVDYTRRVRQPEKVTAEWAISQMSERVNYLLEGLIASELICVSDKEDYRQELNVKIWSALKEYDPTRRGEDGRSASVVHYLTVILDHEVANIANALQCYRRTSKVEVPLVSMCADEAGEFAWDGSEILSDKCRNVRELELKMDLHTMRGLMTPRQDRVFAMLLMGYRHEEIQTAVGVFGGSFYRKLLEPIREICRKCGYEPRLSRECDNMKEAGGNE